MKVTHAIMIQAPAEVVWGVTVDVERWPEWSPTFETIRKAGREPLEIGSIAQVKQPGLPETVWQVTRLAQMREFCWEAHVKGMHMIATHYIKPNSEGTESILELEARGLIARVLWPQIRRGLAEALEEEKQASRRNASAADRAARRLARGGGGSDLRCIVAVNKPANVLYGKNGFSEVSCWTTDEGIQKIQLSRGRE